MKRVLLALLITPALAPLGIAAGQEKPAGPGQPAAAGRLTAETFRGLQLRNIGPTLSSGRISDVAVDPRSRDVWYVAVSSGGLWKTTDRGTSWKPIFDMYPCFSMGCVTLDPKNPDVVWLGTGENQ